MDKLNRRDFGKILIASAAVLTTPAALGGYRTHYIGETIDRYLDDKWWLDGDLIESCQINLHGYIGPSYPDDSPQWLNVFTDWIDATEESADSLINNCRITFRWRGEEYPPAKWPAFTDPLK